MLGFFYFIPPQTIFLSLKQTKSTHPMKRFLFVLAFATPFLWTACSGDPKETVVEDVVPAGMKSINLTSLGMPMKINIPDSSYYPIVDTSETPQGIRIHIGQHFDMYVNTAGAEESNLQEMKKVIEASDELPKNFTVTSDSLLVWANDLGGAPMNHFFMLIKTASGTYYVRDNKESENPFTKEEVDRMMQSAKSLRPIPAATPPAS
jgi:hypothetical protein